MRTLTAICMAVLLSGCGAAYVRTTVERDATTGQPRFVQEIKAPAGAIVELAGQNFTGTLKYNPETQTYDIEIRSGQDAQGVQSTGVDLAALAEIMKMVRTP